MAKVLTIQPFSGPAKNNGATVMYGSTNAVVTKALGRLDGFGYSDGTRNHVLQPESRDNFLNYAIKGISAGAFAPNMVRTQFIIRKVTTQIAGQTNKSLYMSPATWGRQSIHLTEHSNARHTNLAEVTYDYATGQPLTEPRVTVDQFGNDVAAHPTYAVPGHLTINWGNKARPNVETYSAKTE